MDFGDEYSKISVFENNSGIGSVVLVRFVKFGYVEVEGNIFDWS